MKISLRRFLKHFGLALRSDLDQARHFARKAQDQALVETARRAELEGLMSRGRSESDFTKRMRDCHRWFREGREPATEVMVSLLVVAADEIDLLRSRNAPATPTET